jgi:hypothetical protein
MKSTTQPKTAKPFTWIVSFTVAPIWVQDGFTIGDLRAFQMLGNVLSQATHDELQAQVLEAPSSLQLARMQGNDKNDPRSGKVVCELDAQVKQTGQLHSALVRARDLIDSVAYVKTEGDKEPVLQQLDEALALIDPRQGKPVDIEA